MALKLGILNGFHDIRLLSLAVLLALIAGSISSCNVTRRLDEGEELLNQQEIIFVHDTVNIDSFLAHRDEYFKRKLFGGRVKLTREGKKYVIDPSEIDVKIWDMDDVLKQEPNRRIFKLLFHLRIHNIPDPEKVAVKDSLKRIKIEEKNERRARKDSIRNIRRAEKGKDPIVREPKEYSPSFGHLLMYSVGEPPVIIDSTKMQASEKQLRLYLVRKGFFNSRVETEYIQYSHRPKTSAYFVVRAKEPYTITNIQSEIPDERLARQVEYALRDDSVVTVGSNFDIDKLDDQRDKITEYLRDRGYYEFTKDFIYYEVDSTCGNHTVDLTMGIVNLKKKAPNNPDSTITVPHTRFKINNVFVFTEFDSRDRKDLPFLYDTTTYRDRIYCSIGRPGVKPHVLHDNIFLSRGFTFRDKEVEATYKQLASLGIYRTVNIRFKPAEGDTTGTYLDAYVVARPSKKQSFQIQGDGTNTGGFLGIQGTFSYTNKNVFRGAEHFNVRLNGGLEVQQLFANRGTSTYGIFNTLSFGPEVSLEIPKILLANPLWFKNWYAKNTEIVANFNTQIRPDFSRQILNLSYRLSGKPNQYVTHDLGLIELAGLRISLSDEFQARIDELNDAVIRASYQDHIIQGIHYSFTYTDQNLNRSQNAIYYRLNLESAGNVMRGIYSLTNAPIDSLGSYEILGIRFAQFVKTSSDIRYYQHFNVKSSLVYRFFFGVGVPLQNLQEALPFEESFFAGGTNGIRAWRARSLGPGSYFDETFSESFDKIGDIQLEANIEYRFDLFDFIEGALFMDAGNIWAYRKGAREGAHITSNFWREIALGGGVGFRVDLDFFIIRADIGLQLHDPSLPMRERWIFQPKDEINRLRREAADIDPDFEYSPYFPGINFNLGIGYPF